MPPWGGQSQTLISALSVSDLYYLFEYAIQCSLRPYYPSGKASISVFYMPRWSISFSKLVCHLHGHASNHQEDDIWIEMTRLHGLMTSG
jgi:hypothetical protein